MLGDIDVARLDLRQSGFARSVVGGSNIYHDPVVHADEGWGRRHERKRCKGVNLCVLVGEQQVGYRYSEEKRHRRAREFIPASFTGYLVCDGWPGWRTQTDCQRGGCNAHARRPFAAILKINPGDKDAQCIVALYANVYDIEARARVDDAANPSPTAVPCACAASDCDTKKRGRS